MSALRSLALAAFVLAAALGAAAWFVFVPRLPSPTGPSAVGRAETTLRGAQGEQVGVTIWYPRDARGKSPLVLYSPGWGAKRDQSAAQLKALASHGFVVVACDDVGSELATDPSKGIRLKLETDAETAETIQRAGHHAVVQADRLLAVLAALEAGPAPFPVGTIDTRRVGVLGFSLGGTAGLAAAARDPRIVAVFNIDGGLFGPAAEDISVSAYFLLSSNEAFPSASDLAAANPSIRNYAMISGLDIPRNRRRMQKTESYWSQIPEADHVDLSDELYLLSRRTLWRTNTTRREIHDAITSMEVAFFRSTLEGNPAQLRSLAGHGDQTVRWINPKGPTDGTATPRQ